jgi:D-alanine-D-alanine ligase
MFLTSNKVLAKSWLRARGIATPAWHTAGTAAPSNINGRLPQSGPEIPASKRILMPHSVTFPWRCIIKSIWEDASVGLTDESVVAVNSPQELDRLIRSRGPVLGGEAFAEEYVEGREFNVTLLADGDGVHPLPPAEIEFVDFPPGKPRIVGYAAKWQTDSIEYVATPRTLDFRPEDGPLIATLDALARDCWRLFDLRGYARVDFRVDAQGQPLVLEVNANPCLSPDAGFAAAATRAGLSFAQVVERIVADALRESHADLHSPYDPHSPRA